MGLEDIKKSILEQAESQIKEIETEGATKVAAVRAAWDEKLEAKKKEILAAAQRKANQKVQQTNFKLQAKTQTEILQKKQSVIDRVYKAAMKELSELSDAEYEALMEKLLKQLPKVQGTLHSVEGKEALLKKALHKSGRKDDIAKEPLRGAGGFIFKAADVEVDSTFSALVRDSKDQTLLTVSNHLFGTTDQEVE